MPVIATTAFSTAGQAMQLVRSMLNDADIPLVDLITPTGAARVSTVATITTQQAHGLQIGSIVQVSGVSDSSFNGSQSVAAVPTATTFQYVQFGAPDGTSGNGTVSLLVQGDWATDAVLIPLVNKAYRKVQTRLLENGSPSATDDTQITLPAGTIQLNDSTNPQLPVDFLAPRTIRERITGNLYFGPPMEPVSELHSRPQSAVNGCYAWFGDGINFLGALNDTDIWLRYFLAQPYLSDGDSVMLIRGCLDPVADWTAFLAAESRARGQGGGFAAIFEQDMKEMLNMQAHARQYAPARRKPNNIGRRGWFGFGLGR